jgi:hypothetical protein
MPLTLRLTRPQCTIITTTTIITITLTNNNSNFILLLKVTSPTKGQEPDSHLLDL